LLVALPKKSPYRCILDALLAKRYRVLISNAILTEYEEIIGQKTTPQIAQHVIEMLLNLPNVEKIEVFFKWHLIEADWDDNKFSDCAIAGNADLLVSNDSHFNILEQIDFPNVLRIKCDKFIELLANRAS
jgi:uncharacterized protein